MGPEFADTATVHAQHHLLRVVDWFADNAVLGIVVPLLVFAFIYFSKESIKRWVQGFFWHLGRDFDLDDPVMVNERPCRMVRWTFSKTTFYRYNFDRGGRIIFADLLVISNDRLKDLDITRKLENHERPKELKPVST